MSNKNNGPSKKRVYAWLTTELRNSNITLAEFKKNPLKAFTLNKNIRTWIFRSHSYNQEVTWYGKKFKWSDHIGETYWNQLKNNDRLYDSSGKHNGNILFLFYTQV